MYMYCTHVIITLHTSVYKQTLLLNIPYFTMDLYFMNFSIIIWISRIYFSQILVQSIHACDQALTICRSIFHEMASISVK